MRIAPIPTGTRPELAALEATIAAARGRVSPLYQVLLHSPAMAAGWEQMLSAVRNHSSLPAALRELIILRVAVLNGARYEYDAHLPIALAAGLSQRAVESIASPERIGESGDASLQLALELTDALTSDAQVSDALYARAEALWSPQERVEIFVTIAAYNMVSRFLNALQIGH